MRYNVAVSNKAYIDLDNFIYYILFELKNAQAAAAVMDDFDETIEMLRSCAGSLNFCKNKNLKSLGYRRINFLKHNYFMLFRIDGDLVTVDRIFHNLQDFESKMK